MMDSSGSQAGLRNSKTLPLVSEQIVHRHTNVAKYNFTMAFGRAVIHDRRIAEDLKSGRIHWHDDKTLPFMRRCRLAHIRSAEDNQHTCVRMHRAAIEPFTAVDDEMIAVSLYAGTEIRWIGGCHVRLGDRDYR